ncbi:MAG TPA: hypothetical protein VF343_04060 [Syntrophales bacterium]|jgi:hypothetical protein
MKKKPITITLHEDALNAIVKLAYDLDKSVDELLEESIGHLDEQALSDAAAILGETIDELRSHVTHGKA